MEFQSDWMIKLFLQNKMKSRKVLWTDDEHFYEFLIEIEICKLVNSKLEQSEIELKLILEFEKKN